MSEADKAAAILNLWRAIPLKGAVPEIRMRRLKMREVLQHVDALGAKYAAAVANLPPSMKLTAAFPAILRALGDPAFSIFAGVCERQNGQPDSWAPCTPDEVGDLDVEDFSTVFLAFCEMHEAAIATFQKALAKFETEDSRRKKAAALRASLTSLSGQATDSTRSETSPSTGL